MANGGVIASAGTYLAAASAAAHAVPVVCLCGLHVLAPVLPQDRSSLTEFISPQKVMPYGAAGSRSWADVKVVDPLFDYIPPEMVSLFITNVYVIMSNITSYVAVVILLHMCIGCCRSVTILMIMPRNLCDEYYI